MGYQTPQAAAYSGIPDGESEVLAAEVSPDDSYAVVILGLGGSPYVAEEQIHCERNDDGDWIERDSGSLSTWRVLGDIDDERGVLTFSGEAPPGRSVAVITCGDTEHRVPVRNGYFLFAEWDVPASDRRVPRLAHFE